jgi:hypothetical protein
MPRSSITESVKVLKKTLRSKSTTKSQGKLSVNTLGSRIGSTLKKSLVSTTSSKPIKIILIISGHGFCETIECNSIQCPFPDKELQTPCNFDNKESVLHKCGNATKEFHMSVYTKDIKLYSYAPYGLKNWSNKFKIYFNSDGLYYNDFSRIYNVNRQIEATFEALDKLDILPDNFNDLMSDVKERINDPDYISTFIDVNPICKLEPSKIKFDKKSIVKELYQFDYKNSSDEHQFTMLKKPETEVGWVPWFWKLLGYQKYKEHSVVLPHDIFSGIFVAFTNREDSFPKKQELLPTRENQNYNCDFTLFLHIERIGGMKLCELILDYINYWNKYITIEYSENKCQKQINEIVLNDKSDHLFKHGEYVEYNKNIILATRFWREDSQQEGAKITFINNESLYHIVNIILNFNIAEGVELISTFTNFFKIKKYNLPDELFVITFKKLLDTICPMFNVELHLISNACRSTDKPISNIDIDAQIRELQEKCAIDIEVGGKKTKKRKRHTKKRKHLYKKIKTRKYKK